MVQYHSERLISQAEVSRRIGRSKEWIAAQRDPTNRRRDRTFPCAYRVGERSVKFIEHEIDEWLEEYRILVSDERSVDGDTSDGLVCAEEGQPYIARGIEYDPETGECVFITSLRQGKLFSRDDPRGPADYRVSASFYAYIDPGMAQRLSAYPEPVEEGSIYVMASTLEARLRRGQYGESERDQYGLLGRLRKFATRDELEGWLCRPIESRDISFAFNHDQLLKYLAFLVADRPEGQRQEPIECSLEALLSRAPRDCYPGEAELPEDERFETIGEVIDETLDALRIRRTEGDTLAYLRRHLSAEWHRLALADVGVRVELDGDDVQLAFDDPCHAHRARLGRPPL